VIPTGELTTRKILGTTTIVYVAPGAFSSNLNDETDAVFMRLIKPIAGTEDGCNPVVPALRNRPDFYLLVARGNCSFIDKATAAKNAGALGVVVYNSLQGIYQSLLPSESVEVYSIVGLRQAALEAHVFL
jgi:hypothetical protein